MATIKWSFVPLISAFLAATQTRIPVAMSADESSTTAADSESATEKGSSNAADETPSPGIVRGVLINAADGKPVAGAKIILRGRKADRAESNAEGQFQFADIPPDPRRYHIWAYSRNLVSAMAEVDQTVSADGASARFVPLRLEMVDGKQAKFVITSAISGKPLRGATIEFGYPDRRQAQTTALGTALVEALLSQSYEVAVGAPGHAQQWHELDLTQPQRLTELRIELAAGGIARGIAHDAEGKPVAGAVVYYFVRRGYGSFGDAQRTDAEGRFQNSFLPLGQPVKISIQHDDFVRQEREVVVSETTREQEVLFTLTRRPRGASIRGVVKDADGKPVAGAQVVSHHDTAGNQREAVTNSQGQFALNDVAEGYSGYQVYVQAKGFAPDHFVVEPAKLNSSEAIAVTLMPGHTVHGRVVDENGRPTQGVHVSPRSAAYPTARLGPSVQTDEHGRFTFDSLPADAQFDVFAPNYARLMGTELQLDGGDSVTIALDVPGVVRGRVVDAATGRPVRQFRVTLGFCAVTQPNDPKGTYDGKWNDPGITVNSAEGKFLFTPLTNGMPVALTVLAPSYEKAIIGRTVAAKAGDAEELVVSLRPTDLTQRYQLRVRLLGHAGQPAAGAQLRLIVSSGRATGVDDNRFNWVLIDSGQLAQKSYCEQFLSGVTDADGEFEFNDILPGKHLQLAYWGNGVPKGRSLDFDETRPGASDVVTITLPQPARIRGTIERKRFPEAGSIRLSLAGRAFQDYEVKLAEGQNKFEFNDLPPGEYWVSVGSKPIEFSKDGQQFFRISPLASEKIRLQPGETKEVSFTEPDAKQK